MMTGSDTTRRSALTSLVRTALLAGLGLAAGVLAARGGRSCPDRQECGSCPHAAHCGERHDEAVRQPHGKNND